MIHALFALILLLRQCKNYQNRSRYHKVTANYILSRFYESNVTSTKYHRILVVFVRPSVNTYKPTPRDALSSLNLAQTYIMCLGTTEQVYKVIVLKVKVCQQAYEMTFLPLSYSCGTTVAGQETTSVPWWEIPVPLSSEYPTGRSNWQNHCFSLPPFIKNNNNTRF